MKTSASVPIVIFSSALVWAGTAFADVSHADREFMEKAAEAGHAEIEASKLAQTKATSGDVRAFASTMIDDHTKVGAQLDQLAASKNLKVPTEPSMVQRTKIKLLSASSGTSFDKHYANDIGVAAHKDAVALFQKEAAKGSDPDIKAFAANTLPALNHHLEMAMTLQATTKAED
jgi:putative membrane protein